MNHAMNSPFVWFGPGFRRWQERVGPFIDIALHSEEEQEEHVGGFGGAHHGSHRHDRGGPGTPGGRRRGRGGPGRGGPGHGAWMGAGGPPWMRAAAMAFGGPMLGRPNRAGRGDVRAAILALLAEEPMHGYQLMQEMATRSGGAWRPSPGSVYPTLNQLEDEGMVTSAKDGGRRVFSLTDAGKTAAETAAQAAEAPWESFADLDDDVASLREEAVGVAQALVTVVSGGDDEAMREAASILAEARRSLLGLLGEDEVEEF